MGDDNGWRENVLEHVTHQFSSRLSHVGQPSVPLPSSTQAASIEADILSSLRHKLSQMDTRSLPELHQLHVNQWRAGALVRVRCMIRDMFDPELYCRVVRTSSAADGGGDAHSGLAYGLFRDLMPHGADLCLEDSVMGHRQTLCCCTVPWLTSWARDSLSQSTPRDSATTASSSCDPHSVTGNKRGLEDDDDEEQMEMQVCDHPATNGKKMFTSQHSGTNGHVASSCEDVAPEQELSCLVKVYDDSHSLLLNQTVEFVGVLSVHPALGAASNGDDAQQPRDFELAELEAHQPPSSSVPRLHAISWRVMSHCSPLLDDCLMQPDTQCWMAEARHQLLHVLTSALLGDGVAAELLLCQLAASVFSRDRSGAGTDLSPLGQLSVNISQVPRICTSSPTAAAPPADSGCLFVCLLSGLLRRLTEKLCVLCASRAELNSRRLVPCKNYDSNTLSRAALQMTAHTLLIVDETALSVGELNERGVANVAALSSLVRHQRLDYDFGFHRLPYDTDVGVLALSHDGPSLIPASVSVALVPCPGDYSPHEDAVRDKLECTYRALNDYLTDDLLTTLRRYLVMVRSMSYSVPDSLQARVQQDFVQWRQTSAASGGATRVGLPDADWLHWLLVLARLQSITRGLSTLTESVWQASFELRREIDCRKSR